MGPEVWELGVWHHVETVPKSGTLQMRHPTLRHLPEWEMVIATADSLSMLNKRAEIISTCRHWTKFRYTKLQNPAINASIKTNHMLGVIGSFLYIRTPHLLHPQYFSSTILTLWAPLPYLGIDSRISWIFIALQLFEMHTCMWGMIIPYACHAGFYSFHYISQFTSHSIPSYSLFCFWLL